MPLALSSISHFGNCTGLGTNLYPRGIMGLLWGRVLLSDKAMAERESEISITKDFLENIDLNLNGGNKDAVVNEEILLEEDDIPGATLLKLVERCSVVILKRWLLCRGADVSGKKADLIQRYRL